MNELLEAVHELVEKHSPDKIRLLANRIKLTDSENSRHSLTTVFSTPAAASAVIKLVKAWESTDVSPESLALMLLASSYSVNQIRQNQKSELVWTGPTTPFVSVRRTEQALLEVIHSAQEALFITSFVAYDVAAIVDSLNAALHRGVRVSILLELSKEHGGSVDIDVISKMRMLVSCASLYAWKDREGSFADGRVHAKVAVADGEICFITSANLTGHAMEKNMEAGVIIQGGGLPENLLLHLNSLVETGVVQKV